MRHRIWIVAGLCQWALKRYQRGALEMIPVETKGLLLSDRAFFSQERHDWTNDGLSTEYGQIIIN